MTFGCILATVGIVLTAVYLTPQSGLSLLGWTLPLAGIGFGVAVVPVTSTALGVIPPEHSGMAASATNTSRELGAVAGVAILGSVVNGQLTVQLAKQLTHLCLVKSKAICVLKATAFKATIISAVTTGSISAQAQQEEKGNPGLKAIINKVTDAAYGAFSHGLDLSLAIAAGLMLLSAVIAATTIRGLTSHLDQDDEEEPGEEAIGSMG
jgi:hypothetical protein